MAGSLLVANGGGTIAVNTSTETAVMTSVPPFPIQFDPTLIPALNTPRLAFLIRGTINFTPGTGVTSVTRRIRPGAGLGQGSLGPALVIPVTAGVAGEIPYSYFDGAATGLQPGQQAGFNYFQYTVSLQQTGGSTAGNINYMTMCVEVCWQHPADGKAWSANDWVAYPTI